VAASDTYDAAPVAATPGGRQDVSGDELRFLADKAGQAAVDVARVRDRVQDIVDGLDRRGWNAGAFDDQWARTRFGLTDLSQHFADDHTELLTRADEADVLNSRSGGEPTYMAADMAVGGPGGLVQQTGGGRAGLVDGAQNQALDLLDHAKDALGAGVEAFAEALPDAPSVQLDPNGPIARRARGETVDPFAWSRELAGYESQMLLAYAPDGIRNAQVTFGVPGIGDQTMTAGALVALAMDPANLIGMAPVEGPTAAILEKALPYLEGPARAAVSRLLRGIAPELAQRIIGDAAIAAGRTGLSERVMQRSILLAAESSKAAESVGGVIEYGVIDDLGRPTGIRATITDGMTQPGFGTKASSELIPPGYQVQEPALARGHLLGKQLGGSGDVYQNLVTLFQNDANHPNMSGVEAKVRAAIEGGQTVEYTVTPIYEGTSQAPARVHIRAVGTLANGAGDALNLDVTIENVPKFNLPSLSTPAQGAVGP
jgi:DNA/RNA non-specific endonuclease